MDVDDRSIMLYCTNCRNITVCSLEEEFPLCCNIDQVTFGLQNCCKCNKNIEIDSDTPDLCDYCSILVDMSGLMLKS